MKEGRKEGKKGRRNEGRKGARKKGRQFLVDVTIEPTFLSGALSKFHTFSTTTSLTLKSNFLG
jgi:hypothetical protein